jgi:hypothetical protein
MGNSSRHPAIDERCFGCNQMEDCPGYCSYGSLLCGMRRSSVQQSKGDLQRAWEESQRKAAPAGGEPERLEESQTVKGIMDRSWEQLFASQ